MDFLCEDFPNFGVVLVPPSAPEYDQLIADIQRRIDHPVEGLPALPEAMGPEIRQEDRETSAILLNRSQHGIAAIHQVWTFQEVSGRTYTSSFGAGTNPSVLLPFGLSERALKFYRYWQVILPGSKRYLSSNGQQVGDNSDVRPPGPDEILNVFGFGAGGSRSRRPLERVTLTLDGVFFDDGGFVGPNRAGLWEQVVMTSEMHLRLATIANEMHYFGTEPQKILAEIESITGPATDQPPIPPPPSGDVRTLQTYRDLARQRLAWSIGMAKKMQGDERTVYMIMAWSNQHPPQFRKL